LYLAQVVATCVVAAAGICEDSSCKEIPIDLLQNRLNVQSLEVRSNQAPAGTYVVGGYMFNECPLGTTMITTEEECGIALQSIGMYYQRNTSEDYSPKGCYHFLNHHGGRFNTHPTGAAWNNALVICRSDSATTPRGYTKFAGTNCHSDGTMLPYVGTDLAEGAAACDAMNECGGFQQISGGNLQFFPTDYDGTNCVSNNWDAYVKAPEHCACVQKMCTPTVGIDAGQQTFYPSDGSLTKLSPNGEHWCFVEDSCGTTNLGNDHSCPGAKFAFVDCHIPSYQSDSRQYCAIPQKPVFSHSVACRNSDRCTISECVSDNATESTQLASAQAQTEYENKGYPSPKSLATTCCDSNGIGSSPDCRVGQTWYEANDHCSANGLQLCSLSGITGGAGNFSGCGFDALLHWTNDAC